MYSRGGSNGAHQGVHRLVSDLTSLQPIVHLMPPRTHLDDTDQRAVHFRLSVEHRKERRQVLLEQLWLGFGCRVQGGQRQAADGL